ncbi:MAG: M60 family metallopeptidase, partial [Planctomycetota bacterium]
AMKARVFDPAPLPEEESELALVRSWVEKGGGLVASGLGWGWRQTHGDAPITEHPGSRLLAPFGIVFGDGHLDRSKGGAFKVEECSPFLNAAVALGALADRGPGGAEQPLACESVVRAAVTLPASDRLLRPRIAELAKKSPAPVPSPERPVATKDALARLLVALDVCAARTAPPAALEASPAASTFPGAVAVETPRVTETVLLDASARGWLSTGLYAAPGEKVTVTLPADWVGKGLKLRIGAHTDELWGHEKWTRSPAVSRSFALGEATTTVASAFGGLVYVEAGAVRRRGRLDVKIAGAVRAPRFVAGSTTLGEWRDTLRGLDAPWAELEAKHVILTVPSSVVRSLDDPGELLAFWEKGVEAAFALAARPLPLRPERYVTDVAISAGYMHSGYPIMTHLDVAPVMVDLEKLAKNSHGGVWGFWHELGHNLQESEWTFEGTGEVTNNVFALHVMEKVHSVPLSRSHDALASRPRLERAKKFKEAGRPFARWKEDPFLALETYIRLLGAFGWDSFRAVFKKYRELPATARPLDDAAKRDLFCELFSREVQHDLGPFFEAWGVPISAAARAKTKDLPVFVGGGP